MYYLTLKKIILDSYFFSIQICHNIQLVIFFNLLKIIIWGLIPYNLNSIIIIVYLFEKLTSLLSYFDKLLFSDFNKLTIINKKILNRPINIYKSNTINTINNNIILYLHGGGYSIGNSNMYRYMLTQICLTTNCTIYAINYKKGSFPNSLRDVYSFTKYLISICRKNNQKLILAGDSAGGGLCLSLLLLLRNFNQPMPDGCILISPWVDLTQKISINNDSSYINNRFIDYIPYVLVERFAKKYITNNNSRNQYISPLYGDLNNLPPIHIEAGSHEIFIDQITNLINKIKKNNSNIISYHIEKNMIHVYQIMLLSNFKLAINSFERMSTFINSL